jgi:BASS family bile acid:Na+ symporter
VGTRIAISTWDVLQSVLVVVFIPFILSRLLRYLPLNAQQRVRQGKRLTFFFWLTNLFLVTSKATAFILHDLSVPITTLAEIALISLMICAINFRIGAWLGGRDYRQEGSQSLGQKNNAFTIWLALTFVTPLIALGPTFYIVYHNLYNSFQLYRFGKTQLRADTGKPLEQRPQAPLAGQVSLEQGERF